MIAIVCGIAKFGQAGLQNGKKTRSYKPDDVLEQRLL